MTANASLADTMSWAAEMLSIRIGAEAAASLIKEAERLLCVWYCNSDSRRCHRTHARKLHQIIKDKLCTTCEWMVGTTKETQN